jgi:hypothetical protein
MKKDKNTGNKNLFVKGYEFKAAVTVDFNTDEMKQFFEGAHRKQEEIIQRKLIDLESLNKVCTV